MTGASGSAARQRFIQAMLKVAPGSRLANYNTGSRIVWTVTTCKRWDTSVQLTLRCGRRQISRTVGICHSGPDLASSGLRFVGHAPTQRELISEAA